jgi:hypothetical protein
VTLPLGILAFIFSGVQAAVAVLVVGWLLLVPASAVLAGPAWARTADDLEAVADLKEAASQLDGSGGGESHGDGTDPIDELRDRYARGEIDEAELERRLDALLETEGLDPADEESMRRAIDALDTGTAPGESGSDDESDVELEPE